MIDDSSCLLCHNHQEDVLHALWHCPTLSQVWEGDPQWSFRGQTCFGTFQELLSHVIQIGCNVELFAMLVWTIWCRRNTIRVNPTGFPLDQVLQRAIDYLMEFRATQPRKQPTPPQPLAKWSPPVEEYYKINFDGAVFRDEEKASIGLLFKTVREWLWPLYPKKFHSPKLWWNWRLWQQQEQLNFQ